MHPSKGDWLVKGGEIQLQIKRELRLWLAFANVLGQPSQKCVIGWENKPTSYIHKHSPSHHQFALYSVPHAGRVPLLSGHACQQGSGGVRQVLSISAISLWICCLIACLTFTLMSPAVSKQKHSDRHLSHSSSAHWGSADFSATPTDDRTGHTAPQCPLFVGVCQWWWQAKDQEAALRPSRGPLNRHDDGPPSPLIPQTQWADAA